MVTCSGSTVWQTFPWGWGGAPAPPNTAGVSQGCVSQQGPQDQRRVTLKIWICRTHMGTTKRCWLFLDKGFWVFHRHMVEVWIRGCISTGTEICLNTWQVVWHYLALGEVHPCTRVGIQKRLPRPRQMARNPTKLWWFRGRSPFLAKGIIITKELKNRTESCCLYQCDVRSVPANNQ